MTGQSTRALTTSRSAMRLGLLDYVVLETLDRWDEALENLSFDGAPDHPAQRQRAAVLLVAAELSRQGMPLELALDFGDFAASELSFAKSLALDTTLLLLSEMKFVKAAERGYPFMRLTSEGRGLLKVLRVRVQEFEAVFKHLPPAYFLISDLMRPDHAPIPRRSMHRIVSDLVADLVSRPSAEIQRELIDLGTRLVTRGAPRSYRFDKRFRARRRKVAVSDVDENGALDNFVVARSQFAF